LREIVDLQERIDSGQIVNPEQTQLDKLAMKIDYENELRQLEAILNGGDVRE
jgi:hypothetical protein